MSMLHIINHQLLGDSLMATPALKRLNEMKVDFTVYFLDEGIMNIYRDCRFMKNKVWGTLPPAGEQAIRLEAGHALNFAMSTGLHYAYGFANQLGVTIDSPVPDCDFASINPIYKHFNYAGKRSAPLLLIFPESSSCSGKSGQKPNKMLPAQTWRAFYQANKTKYDIFFVHPTEGLPDLPCIANRDIRTVAYMLRDADKVLTVDNGIGHLSSAVGANCYLIGGCVPIPWIWTGSREKTLNCHGNPETITVQHLESLIA